MNNVGVRKAAKFMNCSHPMVIKWTREFAENIRRQAKQAEEQISKDGLPDVIEMDEIYTRVKKGLIEFPYGLLIVDGEVRLLRMLSAERKSVL
jgi:transposase-like protein